MGPRCLMDKVRNSLGVWQARCSQPEKCRKSLDVCWSYLVKAPIGWYLSRLQIRSCGGEKKRLTRDQGLLMIFGPRPTSVGEVWSSLVSVQDIWSGSVSVEDVDAPTEVP